MLDVGQKAICTDEPEKESDRPAGSGKPQRDFKWVLHVVCVSEKELVEGGEGLASRGLGQQVACTPGLRRLARS